MHTAKYTKIELSYKNYHIDIYFKTGAEPDIFI